MKFLICIIHLVLAVGFLSSVPGITASMDEEDNGVLDTTNHDDIVFDTRSQPDGSYIQGIDMIQTTTTDTEGLKMETVMNIKIADELSVSARPEGGTVIDMVIKRIEMSMDALDLTLTCDSRDTQDKSLDEMCEPIDSIKGMAIHLIVDDEGTITESSYKDDNSLPMGLTDQIEQTSHFLRLLPTHPIQPGDTWPVEEDMEDLGMFTGTGKMSGYKEYKGHECMVLEISGSVKWNDEWIKNMIKHNYLPFMASMIDVDSAGSVSYTMFWDNTARIARLSKTEQSYVLKMKDIFDDSMTSTISVVEIFGTATKEK